MKTLNCHAVLIEEMLGTCSNVPAIHEEYIASLAPDAPSREEEVAAIGVDAEIEKSKTVFPRNDGAPFIWDYQVKGFLKSAAQAMNRVSGSETSKLKAFKKILTDTVFVSPRKIMLNLDGEIGSCERPLRAETAQGERITLASSETVPAGTTFDFEIELLEPKYEAFVMELLAYSKYKGFLQWRNSGKGRAVITVSE
jgi:hypothetical protein